MNLVQHQQLGLGAPSRARDDGTVISHVVVQVLALSCLEQHLAERSFTHLARAGDKHHFFGEVALYMVIDIALHATILY